MLALKSLNCLSQEKPINGEVKLETPALISAIVQDVQRAQIGGNVKKQEEPGYRDVEIMPVPQIQMGGKQIENETDHLDGIGHDIEVVQTREAEPSKPDTALKANLSKVEDFSSGNLPQINLAQGTGVEEDVRKEGTPPTVVPISKESPSPGPAVSVAPVPVISEQIIPDPKPINLEFEVSPEVADEDGDDRFVSPWSPGIVDDQPVVYHPPPVVETENDEELEELANMGRTERQLAIGSSHHLSSMFDHHHHHDDLKKHVRDLPLDSEPVRHSSDERRSHDEVSSHRLEHRSGVESPEAPPQPPSLFRVPSVLEQMVDELPVGEGEEARRPLFRVPSVLEQMMDEEPIIEEGDEPPLTPPDVDEYRLDSADFASDKQEGSRSSHSHHALHMPGSHAIAVTTCRDVHLRDSEAGFVLGDTEIAPAAEGISSFSEGSVCEDGDSPKDENWEFQFDDDQPEEKEVPTSKDDQKMSKSKPSSSVTNGDHENGAACEEERVSKMSSLDEKNNESDKLKADKISLVSDVRTDSKAQFYIGDHHKEMNSDESEPLSHREPKKDNNFYSELKTEKANDIEEDLGVLKREIVEESPAADTVPLLLPAEPKIPSLNDLFNNEVNEEGYEQDYSEELFDDYWALDKPVEPQYRGEVGRLDTVEEESHHRDELLRPKPPPGRSERGCISAR